MRFTIYSDDTEFSEELSRLLRLWTQYVCAKVEIVRQNSGGKAQPDAEWDNAVSFLDADTVELSGLHRQLAGSGNAAILCASDPQKAICCYAAKPDGFLRKPVQAAALWKLLKRCMPLWWDALQRIELMADRVPVHLPLYNLIWAESDRKGCVLHCFTDPLLVHLPISALADMLPDYIFLRCQRSYLVNMSHVSQINEKELILFDGTRLPLGRYNRDSLLTVYKAIRGLKTDLDTYTVGESIFCIHR